MGKKEIQLSNDFVYRVNILSALDICLMVKHVVLCC